MGLFDFFKKKQVEGNSKKKEPETKPQKPTFQLELNPDANNFLSKFAIAFNINLTKAFEIILEPVNGEQFTLLENGKILTLNIGSLKQSAKQLLGGDIIKSINLENINISDLKDLKDLYFVADKTELQFLNYTFENSPCLEKLVFRQHNVKSIDLTKNINLEELNCSSNELTELDLTKNYGLKILNCQFNKINNLNLLGNLNLKYLNIRFLPIDESKIVFPKQNNIQQLFLDETKIENIDFSKFINLQRLQVGNRIKFLDITKCKFLESLTLIKSNFEYLDISRNNSLTEFRIIESKIGKLTCNELQSFIIPDICKKLKHKPNLKQKDTIKTYELHNKAIKHNWDDGLSNLKKILKDPNCDIATAKAIFWMGQPNFFLQYQKVSEVPDHSKEQFSFLRNLENRILDNEFLKNIINFNPKTYANIDWTIDSFNPATAKRILDEKIKMEIIGQPSPHFDFNRTYNLKIS